MNLSPSLAFIPSVLITLCVILAGCERHPNATTSSSGKSASVNTKAGADSAGDQVWSFEDVTKASGVRSVYHNGEEAGRNTILESLGGGVGIFDFDKDGILDLTFPGGGDVREGKDETAGRPTRLFRRHPGLPAEDVTDLSGMDSSRFYTHGVAIADADNDGFPDLVVTGYGGLQFWMNHGDGTFHENAQMSGLTDSRWSSSAAWGDLNNDGNVDLYVAHYVNWSFSNNPECRDRGSGRPDICPPRQFQGVDDVAYFSQGNGQFQDVSRDIGLSAGGKGLGVLMADFDQDGDLDIYVANDTENNFHYWNDGTGHLKEEGVISGTAVDDQGVANGSMGLALCDYDGDQMFDIFVANYEDEAFGLYRQVTPRQFLHVSQQAGITALGVLNVGFGSVAIDVDTDGWPDLIVANGHIMHYPRSAPVLQKVMLLKNHHGKRFERARFAENGYLSAAHRGRGLAAGDLDSDGRLDFVFANTNEPSAVVLNTTPAVGRAWCVTLAGLSSNREGIGATLRLKADDGTQVQHMTGGGSYLSANANSVMLTTKNPHPQSAVLEIKWPSGRVQSIVLTADKVNVLAIEPR